MSVIENKSYKLKNEMRYVIKALVCVAKNL